MSAWNIVKLKREKKPQREGVIVGDEWNGSDIESLQTFLFVQRVSTG